MTRVKGGIVSKNRYEWITSYVTCFMGGMIAVPLDKGLTPPEIESSILKSKIKPLRYRHGRQCTRWGCCPCLRLHRKICFKKRWNIFFLSFLILVKIKIDIISHLSYGQNIVAAIFIYGTKWRIFIFQICGRINQNLIFRSKFASVSCH